MVTSGQIRGDRLRVALLRLGQGAAGGEAANAKNRRSPDRRFSNGWTIQDLNL